MLGRVALIKNSFKRKVFAAEIFFGNLTRHLVFRKNYRVTIREAGDAFFFKNLHLRRKRNRPGCFNYFLGRESPDISFQNREFIYETLSENVEDVRLYLLAKLLMPLVNYWYVRYCRFHCLYRLRIH